MYASALKGSLSSTDFNSAAAKEIEQLGKGSLHFPEEASEHVKKLKEELKGLLKAISTTGDASAYDWQLLKHFIVISVKDSLLWMHKKYPDFIEKPGESFTEVVNELIELFYLFETEGPFTLQRICEVVLEPEKNYKSSNKFVYAIERVLSADPSSLTFLRTSSTLIN